ncbi:release factor glutamine methyltransferase [Caldalkalibacillus uzonensis]|uniref:Release factor glutamine methyltransferase n=1 Tax=Caldalkalibacillus uzonensis TaxID=353224 RepID=A0ABU0CSK2_9BACI|nr:peptide chain release factor N(5)-glutamine methyltransferase [Caldalkalibacillus uzonensis]MDQ0339396.1 release factor glutamine methyltransferase [Caldalkalibacillus uzonensis]
MNTPGSVCTCREALVWASSLLLQQVLNPKVAEWVLMHVLDVDRASFLNMLDHPLTETQRRSFGERIKRILEGEPYQYVLGTAEFYGREFLVNRDVLIPRPETELLVEEVLKLCQAASHPLKVVDVGTGSGAIAITLALEMGAAVCSQEVENEDRYLSDREQQGLEPVILAVDISTAALRVAQTNAKRMQAKVTFIHSDWLQALAEAGQRVDLIVSNPPYVPPDERHTLDSAVVDYEPHLALFAENDGLYSYQQIVRQSLSVLNRPGVLAFEVGQGQAEQVAAIIRTAYPQARCLIKPDLQGIERIVVALIER